MQLMSYRHIPFWIRQRIAHTKWYIFVRVAILVEPAAFSDQSYHDAVILIAYALDDLRPWRKTFQPFGGISGIRGATPIKNQDNAMGIQSLTGLPSVNTAHNIGANGAESADYVL
ncbi:uncharacterized protein SEPMUDRAFT_114702 [Sphaerulina musiva SO2202]|uniref:Uncharacterized protein n=1 Tax=Sphaerulina musiva (strain SO2202) TaxID=692275 RepID=M3DCS9_SPHMS|nr:uncharacterized protein SEPMUDRAFT_114702 [Sphaerulina musiva SO2202]EMF15614.1 hypothetical protein SEPMUDRAFT_114702 [Sphaerulina musiva SO2202]